MKKQKRFSCGEAGQSLLEILLAFSVSVLVLSAVVLGISTSLSNAQYTKNQGLANSYAQEGMTIVRQIKDSSWTDFYSKTDVNYCIGQNSELIARVSASCGQNTGIFSREVIINHDDSGCSVGVPPEPTPTPTILLKGSKITVKVSWSDNKCPVGVGVPYCHNVELVTCFSNVDQKQAP